jgi:hypothetical protein
LHATTQEKGGPPLADNIEAVVSLTYFVRCLIHVIKDSVENLDQDIETALITPNWRAMMMVAIEDRKA